MATAKKWGKSLCFTLAKNSNRPTSRKFDLFSFSLTAAILGLVGRDGKKEEGKREKEREEREREQSKAGVSIKEA